MTVALSQRTARHVPRLTPYWSYPMKLFSMLTLSLALASANVLAADPPKPTTKPAATMPPMDHSKMGHGKMDHGKMDHGQMNHGMMDMSAKTPAEHKQMVDAAFAAIDTNKDGSLSKAEFAKHHEMMRMHHGEMMKMDHGKMSMDHGKMADGAFAALDKNRDGSLVKSEIPTQHPLTMHFDMLDTNKDGRLSRSELDASHKMP